LRAGNDSERAEGSLQREYENEQHAAIDKLEEYLDELDNKHINLQEF